MKPLVSVVIPVYNCEAFVAEAVASALSQDHGNMEILVINDGSTDSTAKALQQFGDAIRVISVANGGVARARNIGLLEARGAYIAFLDADDVWLQGKLSAQVAHLEANADVGTCSTAWHVWPCEVDRSFVRPALAAYAIKNPAPDPLRSGWMYGRLLFDCELLTTTVMIRARIARATGQFNTELTVGEDYDYWIRLSRAAKITRLDCIGALYRVLPNSASRTARAVNFEYEVISTAVERFGLSNPDGSAVDADAVARRLDQLKFQHGYLHLHKGDPEVAYRAFAESLRYRPWRPRLWMHSLNALVRAAARRAKSAHRQ